MIHLLSILATIYLSAGIMYLGHKKPHYSHIKHTISELGEKGGQNSRLASYGLFLPTGILLLVISIFCRGNEIVQGLAACISAGYILSAFFPCDAGSPLKGGLRQQIHNLAGVIEYAGGAYFLYLASEKNRELFFANYKVIAILVLVCVFVTSLPKAPVRGLTQRVAETLLFAGLIDLTT